MVSLHSSPIQAVIDAFDDPVTRSYSTIRFSILRSRFLREIGQYLPERGAVLDMGCGFGLFSLYFATQHPGVRFRGVDRNARRIAQATRAAAALGLSNVVYEQDDAVEVELGGPYDVVYMLDLVHHLAPAAVPGFLAGVADAIAPGGRLLIKDIDRTPVYKRLFTHALDLLMDPGSPPSYWDPDALATVVEGLGFSVVRHAMVDVLPYPHILYVCTKDRPSER